MTWISIDERLPELDIPVWLACGDNLFIGCRNDDGDGWLWCNCYGSMYWDKTKWSSFDADADDYLPTHWMPLPTPPNLNSTPPDVA
jgi:hypothetical protein